MAAGLVEKSARLSTQHWIGAANIAKRAAVVRKLATLLIDADIQAFTEYLKAVRAARGLHTAERKKILDPARERIIETPLAVVRAAAEVSGLASEMAEHGNPTLRSDARAAYLLAAAAAKSATNTLADNVRSTKDARLVEAKRLSAPGRRPPSPGRAGGRGRGSARSRGSGPR